MKEMYFVITGCNHYFGTDFMKEGMKVKLEKEPDNEYDAEAIQVKIKGMDMERSDCQKWACSLWQIL